MNHSPSGVRQGVTDTLRHALPRGKSIRPEREARK